MYVWLSDLDAALAAAGVPFLEVNEHPSDVTGSSSWRTRGRPASTGEFRPTGILCHHTASPAGTSDAVDINVIMYGNGSAPGPISQLYIGRSGQVWIIAAGRCNHGGTGAIPGEACGDMNARLLGIEVGNDGMGEWWSDACVEAYAATCAALLDYYGKTVDDVYLHATTGQPCGNAKIDPAGPWQMQPDLPGGGAGTWDLELWRQFIYDYQRDEPDPPHPMGDDDVFIGTPLIQSTGVGTVWTAAGAQHPAYGGALFLTDGRATTYRWLADQGSVDAAVNMLTAAGLPTNIQPVDNMGAYGVIIGPVPGA